MAGVFTALRLRRNSSSLSSSSSASSSSFFQSSPNTYTSGVLFILTLLLLSLAAFAFILQWRGGLPDPRWSPDGAFPGFSRPVLSSSESEGILGRSRKLSFPYFRDWKIKFGSSDLLPKVRTKIFCFYMRFVQVTGFVL